MISRRTFLAAALAFAPTGLCAAPPTGRTFKIGVLFPNSEAVSDPEGSFRAALRRHGYVEGTNLGIETRSATARFDRLPTLASELAALKLDLVVAVGTNATKAVSKAAPTTPIVALNIADPVKAGIAQSLAHPGGNVTGLSNTLLNDSNTKRYELLLAMVPKTKRVAVLSNADNVGNVITSGEGREALKMMNLERLDFFIRAPDDLPPQLRAIANARVDALVLTVDPVLQANMKEIAQFAIAKRLPSVSAIPNYTRAGGLAAYTHSIDEQWAIAADQADKILNGAKPAGLPFRQPTKLDLSFNRSTANALGITIPQDLLLRADFVVE